MKRFISILFLTALLTSCHKTEDNPYPLFNTFTLGNTTYTATDIEVMNDTHFYAGTGINGYYLLFFFGGSIVPGTYHIISPSGQLLPDCVMVARNFYGSGGFIYPAYNTTGSENLNVTVENDNGRLVVKMPKVWAKHDDGWNPADSIQISAYLRQGP